jgi:GNAT superfamily N-acetyltransferase
MQSTLEQTVTDNLIQVGSKRERRQFINFPYKHYKTDKYWVPPLKLEQKDLINTKKNPFFNNADIALFIILRNGEVCGRIAAIEDQRYNKYHETKTGFFGFFECIEDQNVAGQLIEVATEWLKDRGLTEVMGPASPGMMDEIGVLVDGFEYYPSILMPYNKPYYNDLLEAEGFQKEMDLYAFRVTQQEIGLERFQRAKRVLTKRYPDLKIRQVDLKNIDQEVKIVRHIFNSAWSGNWGFIPLTEEEFDSLAKDLKMILDPKYGHIAEMNGEPVAFSIALPDLNQAFKHMNGKLLPIGIFKLLWFQRKINRIRTALMGVLPKYRGKGIDSLLHLKAIENGIENGMQSSELGWVLESNKNMIHVAERLGAHIEKTYRMYSKEL